MALITEDLPALNSPTMTRRKSSSKPFRASTRSPISSSDGAESVRKATASSRRTRSRSSSACVAGSMILPAIVVVPVVDAVIPDGVETEARAALTSSTTSSFLTADAIGAMARWMPRAASTLGGGVGSTAPFAPAVTSASIASMSATPAHPFFGDANTGTEILPRTASATLALGARMRSAPSFAAISAASSSLTPHATTPDAELRDLRATTTGTPSSERTTPSHSADAAISVRSAMSSAARPRRASLSASAALKSSRVVASPVSSARMTAVAPDATAASRDASASASSPLTRDGETAKTKPGMRTCRRDLAAKTGLPSSSSDDPDPPKSLPMADTRRRVSRLHGVPRRLNTPGARAARWLDNLEPKEAPPFVAARGDGAVPRRVGGAGARRGRIPDTALAEATIPCVGMVKCPDVCGGCSRDGQSRRVEAPSTEPITEPGRRSVHPRVNGRTLRISFPECFTYETSANSG